MSNRVVATLRRALTQLQDERHRIDRQLTAVQAALTAVAGPIARRQARGNPSPRRRRMSAAARKAISKRMKAYWAKRRTAAR